MIKIRLKDFFKNEIKPFILGAFLSRIMEYTDKNTGEKYFYAYTSFKASKFIYRY